jgi:uncharacterized protein YbcI
MTMTLKEQQSSIGEYISKLLQDSFGTNPDGIYVSISGTFITIYIRNIISSSEKVLLAQDQELLVYQTREQVMSTLLPEIKSYINFITGIRLREIYFDWNFQNRSGIIAGISSIPFPHSEDELNENYVGKELLDEEIIKVSQHAEKAPEEIYSCELNQRTIVVIRNGILVRMEKEFIRLGFQDLLKSVKRNLEKTYLHNSTRMDSYLNGRVVDLFVDWDLSLDKSIIVIIVNPKEPMGKGDLKLVEREK